MLTLSLSLRHLLLPLSLLLAVSVLSQPADAVDGVFRGWQIGDVAAHPDSDLVYLLDQPRFIRVVNRTSGQVVQRDVAELQLGESMYVLGIGSDAPRNRVYALVRVLRIDYDRNEVDELLLQAYTSELKYSGTMNLTGRLDPPLSLYYDRLFSRTLPVDPQDGTVVFARQLFNGTLLVHRIGFDNGIDTWQPPFKTSVEESYSMALGPSGTLYFMTNFYYFFGYGYDYPPRPLYITTSTGDLQSAYNLSLSYDTCFRNRAIAVSRSTGSIALACDNGIQLFDATGQAVPGFSYTPTLDFYNSFRSLAFTSGDRLLAVGGAYNEAAVQVISTVNGDLLTKWTDGVPALYSVISIEYQPYSRSLVAFRQDEDAPVLRVDADTGRLLQEYALVGRLSQCYTTAGVTGYSGDLHLALSCYEYTVDRGYANKVVLHSMTPAGRVRREVVLHGFESSELRYGALVVAEDKQLFYMLTSGYMRSHGRNDVGIALAFHFNGSLAFNFSDSRIGSLGSYGTSLLRVDDNTLAVCDGENNRIALLDMNSGAFFGNITVPTNTYLVAAAYDGQRWYRSELDIHNNSQYFSYNNTIRAYDAEGRAQSEYFWGNGRSVAALSIAGDAKGQRLYVQDQYDGSVAYWNINAQPSEKRAPVAVEQREPVERQANSAAFEAAVRALRQKGMAEQKQRVEKLQAAAKRRAQAASPTSQTETA